VHGKQQMKYQTENKFQIHSQSLRLNFNFIKSGSLVLPRPILVLGVTNQSNISYQTLVTKQNSISMSQFPKLTIYSTIKSIKCYRCRTIPSSSVPDREEGNKRYHCISHHDGSCLNLEANEAKQIP
jgi:hypothetical protein